MDRLDNDIKYVPGVGEARAKLLDRELGIRTLGDMLRHFPFRYIDRTRIYRIAEITDAAGLAYVQFRARVMGVAYAGEGRRRRFTVSVQDATGTAELVWFQGIKWIEKRIEKGREYLIFGRPGFYRGMLSMAHPELETVEQALSRRPESGMQGIYPSTEKLSSQLGTKGMYQIVCKLWPLVRDAIEDPLTESFRTRYGLLPLREAYYNIHFPQSQELLRQAQTAPEEELPEALFRYHRGVGFLGGNTITPLLFNAFKKVNLEFWSGYIRSVGREESLRTLARFTDLIAAGQGDEAAQLLGQGLEQFETTL